MLGDMDKQSKIYVAGHRGLVGSAIIRELECQGYRNLIKRTREELDLLNTNKVNKFFLEEKPEYVFLAAARVGGIYANSTLPAEFIFENLQIQTNIIHNSYLSKVKKLLFLGSSCIYPKHCTQPIKEEYLLSGQLELTNEPYAIAKIAGIKMCQGYNRQYGTNYICVMPTNLYGINDNFHPENSHVIPGLINKIHNAKVNNSSAVVIWGTGKPRREFLFVDDLANACVYLMQTYTGSDVINIGTGNDITINVLAKVVCKVISYDGEIKFDPSKPDGTPRKLLDITKIKNLEWEAKTDLFTGLKITYKWYLERLEKEFLVSDLVCKIRK